MARIQAGNTLVNQYAPPFVVSDNVAQGWELQWNTTLQAFEAVDPDANTPDAGFTEIQAYSRVLLGAEQRFTLPWAADSKESLIVTIDGVKQHQSAYTASSDTVTNTTILTLAEQVFADQELEVLGLQTVGGAAVEVYGPTPIDSTSLGTVNSYFDLPWLAPSAESLIVTIDGVKQGVNNYNIAANSDFTSTRLTFPDRTITFNADDNSANGNISGINLATDVITTGGDSGRVAHGFTTGQSIYYGLPSGGTNIGLGATSGQIYYVRVLGAYTITLHTTSADAINNVGIQDLDTLGTGETHTLTEITDPYLYVNDANYAITAEGINYAIGDIIFIEGGSPVRKAEFRVTDIGDEAQFTIDTDGAGTVSGVTLVGGGSGYTNGTGLTFTVSDATLAGNQDAVIQYDVVGGAVVGPTVFAAGTGYTINQTGVAVDSIDVDNITRAGNVKAVDLNFAGEYVVFPASGLVTSTDGGGSGALFNIFAVSPQLEVIGITETGQTPASPVDAANMGAPDDVTTFGLYNSKTLSGDAQILNFKSISKGNGISLAVVGDTVQITASNAEVQQIIGDGLSQTATGGGTSLFDQNDPTSLKFRKALGGDRIALSVAGADEPLRFDYDFGYLSTSATTINVTAERLIHVLASGATTVNLPSAATVTAGDTITVKDANGTALTNNISIVPNGADLIDGYNDPLYPVVLDTAREYITLYSNGVDGWHGYSSTLDPNISEQKTFIPAEQMFPLAIGHTSIDDTATGPTLTFIANNQPDIMAMTLPDGNGEGASAVQFKWSPPRNWDEGALYYRIISTTASANIGTVSWTMEAANISDGFDMNGGPVYFSSGLVTDTTQGQYVVTVSDQSGRIGSPQFFAGADLLHFRLRRLDGSDTHTGDALLLGIEILYTTV